MYPAQFWGCLWSVCGPAVLVVAVHAGANPIPFSDHPLGPGVDNPRAVSIADLDGDGAMDILAASANDSTISWFRNDGQTPPSFTRTVLTNGAFGANDALPVDLDRDGLMDVIVASLGDDRVIWLRNQGGAPPTFSAQDITTFFDGPHSLASADLDLDGDIDLMVASLFDNTIGWIEQDPGAPGGFAARAVTTNASGARDVFAGDIDRDGDIDFATASFFDNTIAWFENDRQSPPNFTQHVLTSDLDGAFGVHVADLDGDGDPDVLGVGTSEDEARWYENDGASSPAFTERLIANDVDGPVWITAADIDGDGDLDPVSASISNDLIAWHENDGGSPPQFTTRTIFDNARAATSVAVGDLDSDGDVDAASAASADDLIRWHENTPACPGDANMDGLVNFADLTEVLGNFGVMCP